MCINDILEKIIKTKIRLNDLVKECKSNVEIEFSCNEICCSKIVLFLVRLGTAFGTFLLGSKNKAQVSGS